jgi:hypothetical protein
MSIATELRIAAGAKPLFSHRDFIRGFHCVQGRSRERFAIMMQSTVADNSDARNK